MEDAARIALIEQSLLNPEKFSKVLREMFEQITRILDSPYDEDLRTLKIIVNKDMLTNKSFRNYMEYVGFQPKGDAFLYPIEMNLNKLKQAQLAIERKINFCSDNSTQVWGKPRTMYSNTHTFTPTKILETHNPLLLKIQTLLGDMIAYENTELQAEARQHIPLNELQLAASKRVQEYQKKLKSGEIKGKDLTFDLALLMELMAWFKDTFFSWVDKPECESCNGPTIFVGTEYRKDNGEIYNVENFMCTSCSGTTQFPRYNEPSRLLRTRRGRCGEWANCFTLLARSLGYDVRYVYDTTDHVWCEVFDYSSNSWLHCDPCEAALDTPLLYCHGWNKKLSYVIAVSRDDVQDVTWRYTMNHKEVLKRRKICDETALLTTIMRLREHRQRQVSEARRRHLQLRTLTELVQLMFEKQPTDFEHRGRISGSKEWRMERGEISAKHTFEFSKPGTYCIRYYCAMDKYRITGPEESEILKWDAGVYTVKDVFRKVEKDWQKVYLARSEEASSGLISWRVSAGAPHLRYSALSVRVPGAVYQSGAVDVSVLLDHSHTVTATLGETPTRIERPFSSAVVSAVLRGGEGAESWQHAQLFRQDCGAEACTFELIAVLTHH